VGGPPTPPVSFYFIIFLIIQGKGLNGGISNMPKVTQKGQVTIPHHIRTMLNIKTGDEVNFELDGGNVLLKKKTASVKNFGSSPG